MATKEKIPALSEVLLGLWVLVFSSAAVAFTQSESTQRVPVRWPSATAPLVFEHTPTDITPEQSQRISDEVLATWNALAPFQIAPASFGKNRLSFSSDPRYFGPGVVAVTVLAYDPAVGSVSEGQIFVNQTANRAFCLTADKAATQCQNRNLLGNTRIFFGDVLAHELGHFMGLGHSEVRESTMVFSTFKGQHTPHTDDVAGARTIYGVSAGTITGTVMGGSAVPVFGAHVQAISSRTGAVAAGAISQSDGRFTLAGLDLDETYYLYVEPLRHLESLSDAYRSAKTEFCPAAYVGSFFEKCGSDGKGHPQPLALASSAPAIDVGTVTIRCQVRVGEEYLRQKLATGSGVYDFQATAAKPAQAFVGYYTADDPLDPATYDEALTDEINLDLTRLALPTGANYELELRVLTTEIGSALDFSVELQGAFGTEVDPDRGRSMAGDVIVNREPGTQRLVFSRRLRYPLATSSALNQVRVRLSPRPLSATEQRENMVLPETFALRSRPWLVMTTVLRNGVPYLENREVTLSDNRACLDAPLTFAVRPNPVSAAAMAGNVARDEAATTPTTAATCGSWEPPSDGGSGGPGAMMLSLVAGALLAIFPRLRRRS